MKKICLILILLLPGSIIVNTCKKVEKQMLVSTGTVTNILPTTVDVTGKVLDLGDGATEYGHCYSTSPNSNIAGTKTEYTSPAIGGFTSALTGLTPSTKYYIKAYLKRGSAVVYGEEINFITASDALPSLTTAEISGVSKNSAASGGNISDQGGTPVSARGVCWGTATLPTVSGSKTVDGSGTGSFTSSITGLSSGTKYYVRSYATNAGGTAYGNELNLTTDPEVPVPPTVTTGLVSLITTTTASCGGEVTYQGGANVSAKGVCWATSQNPIVSGSHTMDGSGLGSFTSNITGLSGNTNYYVRAYAINSAGTAYGEEKSFKTSPVAPSLTTTAASSITSISAKSGGTITSDGGSAITASGICWSTNQNPTVSDTHTSDGSSSGTFISSMTGLTPGATYYVRAYATNANGTSYGNQISFVANPVVPTLTTLSVSTITSTSGIGGGSITNDGGATITAKGVCWNTAQNPTIIANSKTTDGSGSGSFSSTITALSPGTTYYVKAYATNSAGTGYGPEVSFKTLAVVPTLTTTAVTSVTYNSASSGGTITNNGGAAITARGVCWSTSQSPTIANSATSDGAGDGSFTSAIASLSPSTTYYVKAYATNSAGTGYGNQQPFTTSAAPYISVTSPIASDHWLGTEVKNITWTTNVTGNLIIALYKSGSLLTNIVASPGAANTGSYTWTLPGNLVYGTDYKIRLISVNSSSIYGESPLFKISEATGTTGTAADADGNTYGTIKINRQWWMASNLKTRRYNDYSTIPGETNVTNWLALITPAYCMYDNLLSNLSTYGAMYNWYAVNTGKLCPTGWHVPTAAEFDELVNYVGGSSVAGGKLKEVGLTHWRDPNTSATDQVKFTALPGGLIYSTKGYGNLTLTGLFWTTTEIDATHSSALSCEYNLAGTSVFSLYKYSGISVRCIKNQ
jgi:uncharacterized protein (TIGR02145 family)